MRAKPTMAPHRVLAKLAGILTGRKDLVGFGHAFRLKGGYPTKQRCLAVFVSKKLKREELSKQELLPKSVTIDGKRYRLDVIGVGRLRKQVAFGESLSCDVYAGLRQKGTPSGYFMVGNQRRVLSCAHVIWGDSPTCPNPAVTVSSSKPTAGGYTWTTIGKSTSDGRIDNGSQKILDWGWIDCASAQLDPVSSAQIPHSTPVRCFTGKIRADFDALAGKRVTGQGLMTQCVGQIYSVLVPFEMDPVTRADLIIVPIDPNGTLTVGGDSGMIWKLDDGTAVGIHSLGNIPDSENPDAPSTLTIGTFIQRVLAATHADNLTEV